MRSRRVFRGFAFASLLGLPLLGLAACGSDDDGGGGSATSSGGGSASAGAPAFESFEVTSPVPCEDGNATATMSYTTINVVSIEIKIGDGTFEGTAGYGPNETGVVAEIPCSGAGESSIQLRGCTEDNECAESESKSVEITG